MEKVRPLLSQSLKTVIVVTHFEEKLPFREILLLIQRKNGTHHLRRKDRQRSNSKGPSLKLVYL